MNAVDYSGYPDCRPAFISAFEQLANVATKAAWKARASAFTHRSSRCLKRQIIEKGTELGVDFSLTHSCYDPTAESLACGECDSCRIRLEGFREAGLPDPIAYANK